MDNNEKTMLLNQKEALENSIKQLILKEHLDGPEIKNGKMLGQICFKKIRCGKKGCKCTKGPKENVGHGPYPHLQWWDEKKIKTRYLNKKKYPIYEKIIHYQNSLKIVNKKLKAIEKTKL